MIRIAVIDDHPALRAGLRTVIDAEPGLVFVGESAGDDESLWPLLRRTDPDLVLLDYHLPHSDGLQVCHRIKRALNAPKVLVYSAYAGPGLALPAALAGADGLLDKGLAARELFEAIRLAHRGERLLGSPSSYVRQEALAGLADEDRPIVGLLLDGTSETEVAQVLRRDPGDVDRAVRRILAELGAQVATATD
jgi:DNA-binding NarL/FixJ family response regulator